MNLNKAQQVLVADVLEFVLECDEFLDTVEDEQEEQLANLLAKLRPGSKLAKAVIEANLLVLHAIDWNGNDRLFRVPHDAALAILKDDTLEPNAKMNRIWDLACSADGVFVSDPRVSDLGGAAMCLDWPFKNATDERKKAWEEELAFELQRIQ